MSDEPIKMTHEEWVAKGKALFGDDMLKWKFVCPGCGHVQTPEDFRAFKDKGATPDSARNECIGRYTTGGSWIEGKGDAVFYNNHRAYSQQPVSGIITTWQRRCLTIYAVTVSLHIRRAYCMT